MNKLAEFPLERAGLGDAPDHTVIVAWPAWSLTVGDVRAAVASQEDTTPQHSVTEQASIDRDAFWVLISELKNARPGHDYRQASAALVRYITEWADNRAQPLASTAATQLMRQAADEIEALKIESLTHRATTAAPVAWRDALRRAGYKDYHGLIAFTPAQLENFVSMLAAAPDIVTTAADQQGDTASELQLHRVVPALRQTKKGQ